ncbi:hypothetical protein [Paracoccus sp. SY]|uniref:hypothetical protein n=1 Tax=Paracoccus sp. SY TaxID=1330255 RepID=UPI0011AEE3D2|nr:hypothetical protein [Paracoccus sp. SY]
MAPARIPSDICAAQHREAEIQAALRQAIALGEREPALNVLKQVAEALNIDLHDSDPDTWVLAHQTNRLLMEVSAERARRETGDYGTASILSELARDVPDALPTDAFLTPPRQNVLADAFDGPLDSPRAAESRTRSSTSTLRECPALQPESCQDRSV